MATKNLTLKDRPLSMNEAFEEERVSMLCAVDHLWLVYEVECVNEGKDPELREFYARLNASLNNTH